MARCWSMVVLATEARKVSVEDAISLDRAVRFRENAGGRSGNNRRSYRDISMTARKKPARLKHECLALNRMPKMRREDETRLAFPGENWIRRLSRTGRWQTTQPRRTSADQQPPSTLHSTVVSRKAFRNKTTYRYSTVVLF